MSFTSLNSMAMDPKCYHSLSVSITKTKKLLSSFTFALSFFFFFFFFSKSKHLIITMPSSSSWFSPLLHHLGHVRFAEKTSWNTVPTDLLWGKNIVPAKKISWKIWIIREANRANVVKEYSGYFLWLCSLKGRPGAVVRAILLSHQVEGSKQPLHRFCGEKTCFGFFFF